MSITDVFEVSFNVVNDMQTDRRLLLVVGLHHALEIFLHYVFIKIAT